MGAGKGKMRRVRSIGAMLVADEPVVTTTAVGNKEWRNVKGELHREDDPAVEYADGTKEWYANGQRHREDGPAIKEANGTRTWYVNGQLHRADGPAFEDALGTKEWYMNGHLHRANGPAIEYADGRKEWYINGNKITEDAWRGQRPPMKVDAAHLPKVSF